jgi:hypothetical protein
MRSAATEQSAAAGAREQSSRFTPVARAVRGARAASGLSRAETARRALLSEGRLRNIEWGDRTRRSTLERIAIAIASSGHSPGEAELLERFLAAAGDELAPESVYRLRIERRRLRRSRQGRYALKVLEGYCPHCRRPL